jgi:hypothetical protein
MAHDLFVSYSSKDRDRVRRWVQQLASFGVVCWMDEGGIDGAMLYGEEIVVALRSSSAVLLFLSRASVQSHNVIKEVTLAAESRKPILPFFLEDVDVPPALEYQLAGVQRIAAAGRADAVVITDLLRALSRLGIPAAGRPAGSGGAPFVAPPTRRTSSGSRGLRRHGVLLGVASLVLVGVVLVAGWALLRRDVPAPSVPTPAAAPAPTAVHQPAPTGAQQATTPPPQQVPNRSSASGGSRDSLRPDAGSPWAVICGSIDQKLPDARSRADILAGRLNDAGISAGVFDGRDFPTFRCCYWSVIAGSFSGKAEADELVQRIKNRGFDVYKKRAF